MSRQSRVCLVSTAHPASDIRVFEKEAVSLVKAGFDVYLVARSSESCTIDSVHVISNGVPKGRLGRFTVGLPRTVIRALRVHAQVYHLHDPELLLALPLLRLIGKTVVLDFHEDIPFDILGKAWLGPPWLRRVLSTAARRFLSTAVCLSNASIAATPPIAVRLGHPGKVVTLRNLVRVQEFDSAQAAPRPDDSTLLAVYAGGLSRARGIDRILDATATMRHPIKLLLLGAWENPRFQDECSAKPGWASTRYVGLVSSQPANGYVKSADIGIALYCPLPNHMDTMPNKPFEYMAAGLPMVMSDFPYWRATFGECALFADPDDTNAVARCLDELAGSRDLCRRLGKAGRHLVETEYSWEQEQDKLVQLYRKLVPVSSAQRSRGIARSRNAAHSLVATKSFRTAQQGG
jgi:glycosyltransferase involved in cell wall biosynthesis